MWKNIRLRGRTGRGTLTGTIVGKGLTKNPALTGMMTVCGRVKIKGIRLALAEVKPLVWVNATN
jgi:hypothetical protein